MKQYTRLAYIMRHEWGNSVDGQNLKSQMLGGAIYQYRTGIVIGALIGLMSGGFAGLLFGGVIGFVLHRALSAKVMPALNIQRLFFEGTFAVMGKVAKADGRVTEQEISYAREVMSRMNLA